MSKIYLSNRAMHSIAIWAIEEGGVYQDKEGYFTEPRVPYAKLALEYNKEFNLSVAAISGYHIAKSMAYYNEFLELRGNVAKPQATVNEDKLTIEVKKRDLIIEEQKRIIDTQGKTILYLTALVDKIKDVLKPRPVEKPILTAGVR